MIAVIQTDAGRSDRVLVSFLGVFRRICAAGPHFLALSSGRRTWGRNGPGCPSYGDRTQRTVGLLGLIGVHRVRVAIRIEVIDLSKQPAQLDFARDDAVAVVVGLANVHAGQRRL